MPTAWPTTCKVGVGPDTIVGVCRSVRSNWWSACSASSRPQREPPPVRANVPRRAQPKHQAPPDCLQVVGEAGRRGRRARRVVRRAIDERPPCWAGGPAGCAANSAGDTQPQQSQAHGHAHAPDLGQARAPDALQLMCGVVPGLQDGVEGAPGSAGSERAARIRNRALSNRTRRSPSATTVSAVEQCARRYSSTPSIPDRRAGRHRAARSAQPTDRTSRCVSKAAAATRKPRDRVGRPPPPQTPASPGTAGAATASGPGETSTSRSNGSRNGHRRQGCRPAPGPAVRLKLDCRTYWSAAPAC